MQQACNKEKNKEMVKIIKDFEIVSSHPFICRNNHKIGWNIENCHGNNGKIGGIDRQRPHMREKCVFPVPSGHDIIHVAMVTNGTSKNRNEEY